MCHRFGHAGLPLFSFLSCLLCISVCLYERVNVKRVYVNTSMHITYIRHYPYSCFNARACMISCVHDSCRNPCMLRVERSAHTYTYLRARAHTHTHTCTHSHTHQARNWMAFGTWSAHVMKQLFFQDCHRRIYVSILLCFLEAQYVSRFGSLPCYVRVSMQCICVLLHV